MSVQILFKRGTAADWTTANPILGSGEPGVETDTGKFKIGNGISRWAELGYISGTANLENLSNVSVTSPTVGQVLKYNGSSWVNMADNTGSTDIDIDSISDVIINNPTVGQVLKYNGAFWINETVSTGGGSLPSRANLSSATGTLAAEAASNVNLTGYTAYSLLKIATSAAAWVRIYVSDNARQADSLRLQGEDPLPGSGVIAEVITSGAETVVISPGTIGFNNESPITNIIPMRVTNLSGSSTAITVTLTAIQLEA